MNNGGFRVKTHGRRGNGLLSGHGLRTQLLRSGIGSGAVKVVGTLLSFAVTLALARSLGPERYGIYSYVLALAGLLSIPAQFGLPQLLVRETAKAQAATDWPALKGVWRWAGSVALVSSLLLAIVAGAVAWSVSDGASEAHLATFAWGLALMPVLVMTRLRGAALRGLRHVVTGQLPDDILRPALFGAIIIFGLSAGDALTASRAMALHVFAASLAFLMGAVLLRSVQPLEGRRATPRFEHRAWFRAMLPLGLTAGMMVITRQSDIVLLGLFVEAEQVGIYRVAGQAAMLVAFGLQAVNMVAGPQITRLYKLGEPRKLQRLATGCARASLAIALPATVAFSLFGEELLRWVVGAEYAAGAAVLAILALGQLANAGMGSVGLLLNMTDHETVVTRTLAFAAAGNIVANLILIPLWGMNGAAVATAATFVLWNVLLARAVKQRLGINSTAFTLSANA